MGEPSIIHGLLYIRVGIHNSRGFIDGRTIYNPYVHCASIHNFRAIIDERTIYNSQIIIHRKGQALSIIQGILWMGSRLHLKFYRHYTLYMTGREQSIMALQL